MDLIRRATQRLEQLEQAGVRVPWDTARRAPPGPGAAPATADAPPPGHAEPSAPATGAPCAPDVLGAALAPQAAAGARVQAATAVTLDFEALRRAGLLVPGEVKSDLAHQFRRIKRPLLKNASALVPPEGNPGSLVMITSAIPGEGKTFCAINLAMSMAMEVDTAVLLVDADVVRPSVLDRLGIQVRPPGLLDLLTQPELALGDAVMSTNVPKLSILSAGVFHEQSTELLASAAMGRLLERLVSGFADHILIFDGPPLLPTTESAILASKVGQVVVVVEAQRTSRVSVQQAFASLRGCPIVMSVLNKTDEAAESRNYGYAQG